MVFILTISCPNRPGIVAAVSTCVFEAGGDILESQQFDDVDSGRFFMRLLLKGQCDTTQVKLRERLTGIARDYAMSWHLRGRDAKQRVLLLASKFDHCLADILYRWRIGELPMEIVGVISNHPRETYENLNFTGLRFDYLPVTKETKSQQEARIWSIVEERDVDLVILARYMQILSDDLSARLAGRCINIHHSFLPGFKGARPYHQAHERGVKLIGATAHYVTGDLDEGPIIEQDVERVSHLDAPDDLVRKGRDIERRVLAKAIRWHLDGRVFANGQRTIVFRD
jgi:formyltetrahydrofolate deformylase